MTKNNGYKLAILLSVASLFGCRATLKTFLKIPFVSKTIFGFKNPQIIDTSQIVSFALKKGADTADILYPSSLHNLAFGSATKIFNKNGEEINIHTACVSLNPAAYTNDTSALGFNTSELDSEENISAKLKGFYFSGSRPIHIKDTISRYDLIFLVPFTTWFYRPSFHNIEHAKTAAAQLKSRKVKILYMNLDPRADLFPRDSLLYYKKSIRHSKMNFTFD